MSDNNSPLATVPATENKAPHEMIVVNAPNGKAIPYMKDSLSRRSLGDVAAMAGIVRLTADGKHTTEWKALADTYNGLKDTYLQYLKTANAVIGSDASYFVARARVLKSGAKVFTYDKVKATKKAVVKDITKMSDAEVEAVLAARKANALKAVQTPQA